MDSDLAATLQDMRDRFTARQREIAAIERGTARLLANGRATLKQGRDLIEWFHRAERARLSSPDR
jgi:hypothetical protein